MKRIKRLLLTMLLMPVFPVMWNDPPTGDPPAGDPPAGDPPADPPADDLSTLFTPEEVTAKKEAIEAAKAEEARRAALTQEQRDAEDAAKLEADKKGKVPENYDFKLPEGFEVDKELLELAVPIFKKAGLTQEMAQEFVDIQAKLVEKRSEQWEADKSARMEAIKTDKELGGDNLPETKEVINRFVNTFLSAEESQQLAEMMGRFGDIPVLTKLLTRAGKQIREGKIVQPGSSPSAGESERILSFYGKSNMSA